MIPFHPIKEYSTKRIFTQLKTFLIQNQSDNLHPKSRIQQRL